MADDKTTPEDVENAEKSADATERKVSAAKELKDLMQKALGAEKESTKQLLDQLDALEKSKSLQDTLYTARIRSQESRRIELELLARELEDLDKKVKKGEKLEANEQRRYELLTKQLENIRTAHEKNNELIAGSANLMERKVGAAVAQVADMLQRDLGSKLSIINNTISNLADQGFSKLFNVAKELVFQLDSLTANFERQMQLGPAYTESVTRQYEAMNQFGVSMEDAFKAQEALVTNMTDFTMLSQTQRDAISEAGLLLQEQGVSMESMSRGMQASTKFFGQTSSQAIVSQQELAAAARELGRVPGEFAEEFAAAAPSLAKFGDQGVKAFKDLGRIAKITGMEMEKMLSITNRFDTFEGAAEMAGQLNAAIGGNMVNAMDMMMETDPAARFMEMRESILNTVGSFDDMSYYQKQFFTEAMGLGDVSDLAVMLSGDMDMLSGAQNESAESLIEQRRRAEEVQSAQEALTLTMHELVEALLPARDIMKDIAHTVKENAGVIQTLITGLLVYKGLVTFIAAREAFRALTLPATATMTATIATATQAQAVATAELAASVAALNTQQALHGPVQMSFNTSVGSSTPIVQGATPAYAAFGVAALKVGTAALLVGLGVAAMAFAFSLLEIDQMAGMVITLIALGAALYFAGPAFAKFGALASLSLPVLGMIALVFLSVGAAAALVGWGIQMAAEGFAKIFEAIDLEKAAGFAVFMGTLVLAAKFAPLASTGIFLFAYGIAAVGVALYAIPEEKLTAIGNFAKGISEATLSDVTNLATGLSKVATAMKEIPEEKAIALTATMEAAAVASTAAQILAGNMTSNTVNQNTPGNNQASMPEELTAHITLELNGEVLSNEIVRTVLTERRSGGRLSIPLE